MLTKKFTYSLNIQLRWETPWGGLYSITEIQWKEGNLCNKWCSDNWMSISEKVNLAEVILGRKVMTNLDSIFKSRDITLLTKVHLVKAMVFPVVMYGCESWTVKKAEHRRIDAFELWCWRRL